MSEAALRQLCRERTGLHNLLVFDDIVVFREVYCEIAKAALPNNEILIIMTYFETPDQVKFYLREAGVNVDLYGKTGSLFVIDSVEQFFGTNPTDTLRFIELLNKKVRREGKKGVIAIIDMDAFFHLQDAGLEKYELEVPSGTAGGDAFLCLLCAYHRGNFERLDPATQKAITSRHSARAGI
ncbi:MEDS domain-containing protein [Nitrososphaera sp.]|uniref:MEDS domain-containing protein n=1 Tax=Nitrososphaera sp. TaxID=1971748 RepID=UPI00307F991A